MSVLQFIAAQLRQPSGFIGRNVILHFLNRSNSRMNDFTLKVLQLNPDDRVLEVGFGGGDLMARMAREVVDGHITGVDFSADAVAVCKKRFSKQVKAGIIDLYCANVNQLPIEANTCTKACTVNTIYFWPSPLDAISQIHRTLKQDGLIVVCFSPRACIEHYRFTQHGFILYEPEEVSSLLLKAGFRDVQLVLGENRYKECAIAVGKK